MNNKIKLIIFFGIIAIILFALGIVWSRNNGGNIEASTVEIGDIQKNEIVLTLDDYLSEVSPGSKSIYNLVVANNSKTDFNNVRIYGYVALPTEGDLSPIAKLLPEWLVPGSLKYYSDKHHFDYLIDLKAKSKAEAKITIKIKKYFDYQDKVYSKAYIQVLTQNTSRWNIFSLGGSYDGPIIAVTEDVNDLK